MPKGKPAASATQSQSPITGNIRASFDEGGNLLFDGSQISKLVNKWNAQAAGARTTTAAKQPAAGKAGRKKTMTAGAQE